MFKKSIVVAASALMLASASAAPIVEIITNKGTIVVDLDSKAAPKTVENFLNYTQSGFYKGTIFHRVIDGFMIQGGGFTADMKQKTTNAPIKNEAANGLKNDKYTIAMARTSEPNSATSQFFINTNNNAPLNYSPQPMGDGYAVFGKVIKGMEVVDSINKTRTAYKYGYADVPTEAIVIQDVRLAPNSKAAKAAKISPTKK